MGTYRKTFTVPPTWNGSEVLLHFGSITGCAFVYVNGQKATVADLKPGMRVTVTAGLDRTQAARIEASGAPKKKKKSGG